jgi:hypothetical protein
VAALLDEPSHRGFEGHSLVVRERRGEPTELGLDLLPYLLRWGTGWDLEARQEHAGEVLNGGFMFGHRPSMPERGLLAEK